MHGREDQLDGPFGRQPLGLERVGEAQPADRQVGPRRPAAVELAVDVLPLGQSRGRPAAAPARAPSARVDVGRADLDGRHAAFARQEAGQRDLELAVGEEEDAAPLPASRRPPRRPRGRGRAAPRSTAGKAVARHAEGLAPRRRARRSCPPRRTGRARRSARRPAAPAPRPSRRGRAAPAGSACSGPDAGRTRRHARGGQHAHRHAQLGEQPQELVLDHVRQRADQQQLGRRRRSVSGRPGTIAARQASSPSVKVVSMPEPE